MRIQKLILYTKQLAAQKEFYSQLLGISLCDESETSFSLNIGSSILCFESGKNATPYHFAFNIPPGQVEGALGWLKKRVEVLPFESQEIVDFKNWNARAIYFYDADRNIVEFIGRRNLKQVAGEAFSANNLVEISEIGVALDHIVPFYETLQSIIPVEVYDGDFNRFCAIGDEHGLFIAIDRRRKKWIPCNDEAFVSDFKMVIDVGTALKEVAFTNGSLSGKTIIEQP